MNASPEDHEPRFSFWRAVRLLSISLEVFLIVGSVAKFVLAFGFSMEGSARDIFVAAYNVVLFSFLLFLVIQLWMLFRDRRRALFALARGIVYFLVAGWGLLAAA